MFDEKREVQKRSPFESVVDRMRVLEMALWGIQEQSPNEDFMDALASFVTVIREDLEVLRRNV